MSRYNISRLAVKKLWDEFDKNNLLNQDSKEGSNWNGDDEFAHILDTHLKKAYLSGISNIDFKEYFKNTDFYGYSVSNLYVTLLDQKFFMSKGLIDNSKHHKIIQKHLQRAYKNGNKEIKFNEYFNDQMEIK